MSEENDLAQNKDLKKINENMIHNLHKLREKSFNVLLNKYQNSI